MQSKTVYLYLRVSTDEQASKGFSLGYQEDSLRKYCLASNLKISQVISEDYSAKSFSRPQWSNLLQKLKRDKITRPNYILFTKWDRFSRNAADAYFMIKILQTLGVEPQAIEQPLDLSIPENKITLAFYLVAPEVENDRRSLNVKSAMYKAKLEGRWMGTAPIGYANLISATGQKYIAQREPAASLLKEAFEQIGQRQFNIHQVYKMAVTKGLVCSLTNFCHAIRNPVYCGNIVIVTSHNQPPIVVEGKHEKLIPTSLFDEVQNVINNKKKKNFVNRLTANDLLPFRGFLYCPRCGHKLTGSGSTGRTKHYYYYHCNRPCTFRVRADIVHDSFFQAIKTLEANSRYLDLFKSILEKIYKDSSYLESINQRHTVRKIDELHDSILSARSLLLTKDINGKEYHAIKMDYEAKISILENKLKASNLSLESFKNRIELMSLAICNIPSMFKTGDIAEKRELIQIFFQKNIIWSESGFYKFFEGHVLIIYGMERTADSVSNFHHSNIDVLPQEYQAVIAIEQSRCKTIEEQQVQSLIAFLYDFARLTIDHYTSKNYGFESHKVDL